jgi:basic membrane protein A
MVDKLDRRRFLWYSSATLASALLLKACGSPPTESVSPTATGASPAAGSGKGFKMAIALPGVISDGGWNQSGYEGVKRAAAAIGAEMGYVEKVAQPDQAEALADFARQGYSLVAGHGGQFDAAIQQVAAEFPDTFFLAVNGDVHGKNYASVVTNYMQLCYLCGVVGAGMTKSQKLAYLTGLSFKGTQQQAKAFELGAKSVNPQIEVVSSITGDFNDIAKGKEAALALISSGVDVILHNLDNSSPAVLETAQEKGIYALGNVTDQLTVAPKAVLTSAVQDIGGAIAYVAEQTSKGQFEGKKYILGLEKPEIAHLGKFNDIVPAEVQKQVETIEKNMLAGKLTFEDCQENGQSSVCVKS